jgi:VCBS repeat-containing protein
MWSRRRSAVLLTLAVLIASGPMLIAPRARAATPTLENPGTVFENTASSDDAGRDLGLTLLVRHDLGQSVTGLALDTDYNGTDNTSSIGPIAVTPQKPAGNFNYSRVSFTTVPPKPSGFSCPLFGTRTRVVTVPIRVRAVTSDGQRTSSVSQNVSFVEDAQCNGTQDFPVVQSRSQNATSTTPGGSIGYTFSGDDADVDAFSSDDDFDRIRWRVRRQNDGTIVQSGTLTGLNDNENATLTVTFAQRGRYVVEGEPGNENGSIPRPGDFYRLGGADVNSAASDGPSVTLAASPTGIVQQGQTVNFTATASDVDVNGRVQMIEWSKDATPSSFERREVANLESTGLTLAQRQESLDTTGLSGTRTVVAQVTDNGAMNGADTIRRTKTATYDVVINRPPDALNQTVTTNEDDDVSFTLSANNPDAGETLSYTITNPPDHGDLTGVAPNLAYDPDPNFSGSDTIGWTVTDGRGGTDSATVTINVTAVNDAPVAQDQDIATDEDTTFSGTLLASDVDNTAAQLTFSLAGAPTDGTATIQPDGDFTYAPNANAHGADSFTFNVCDPSSACDEGTVDITVNSVNDTPVPDDQQVETDEDTDLAITLTASDADGDSLIFSIDTPPEHGTLSGVAPNVTYEPDPNFFGTDAFTFLVSDGTTSAGGTVDITVNPVNDAPVAQDQAVATDEDVALDGQLDAIDVDDIAGDLTYALTTGPSHGSVVVNPDGSYTYTPNANFNGDDSFTFTVCDPDNACDEGLVSVTVNPVNDPPVPDDQSVTMDEDTALPITLTASDADGDTLTFAVVTPPSNGTIDGVAPNLEYTPNPNFFGEDTFTFSVSDAETTITGTVDITVDPVNDAPSGQNRAIVTDEDTAFGGDLAAVDVDDPSEELAFALGDAPSKGTAVVGEDGAFTYTPDANQVGSDTFTFSVCDPDGACDEANVAVTIRSVNDAPTAEDADVTVDEDQVAEITLATDDVDGDSLTYTFSTPAHGTVVGGGALVAYTPDPNFNGTDSFTYTVSDGHGGTATATVDVVIDAVNDFPDAIPQVLTTAEDTSVAFVLTAEDIDGDDVVLAVTEPPAHGTLSGSAPDLVYTPDADFSGVDFVEFTACDADDACDTAVVSISVAEQPLIPTQIKTEASVVRLNGRVSVSEQTELHLAVPLTLRATLTGPDSLHPLPNQILTFSVGGQVVCTAKTNGIGVADCGGVVAVARSVLALGYRVDYAGDADHAPESARGNIVLLAPIRIRVP